MNLPRLLRTWRSYRRLFAGPAVFLHRHDPALQRAVQRRAAREAWLSTRTTDQRRLAHFTHGDTQ